MSLTIKYLDAPDGAQAAATVTGNGLQPFSVETSAVTGADDVAWATTENDQWILDGTRELIPDTPGGIGWWSSTPSTEARSGFILGKSRLGKTRLGASSPGCIFQTPLVLAVDFSERFSATGITITFSPSTDQWCTDIIVRWYREGVILAEVVAQPEQAQWTGGDSINAFDRITIELRKTNRPGQLAKIQQIMVGQLIVFGRDEIISAQLVNEVDHTLGTLPVDISRFEVLAPDDLFLNPKQNQRVELYRDKRLLATHYIETGKREYSGNYVFNCQSAIGTLENDFMGGIYDKAPVMDVISEILGAYRFEIDPTLAGETITGYIPVCTRREALQQVVFAIGAMVSTHGSNAVRFLHVPTTGSGVFTDDLVFPGSAIEIAQRVAAVEVIAHRYKKSNTVETLIDDEEIDDEDALITFADPHWDYSITGGTITGSGANWITVTAAGPVTVAAKTYTHTTTVRAKKNPDATNAERGNVISVTDATLVNSSNVKKVLNRIAAAADRRWALSEEVVVSDQTIGDYVESVGPWGNRVAGIITAMDGTLTQSGHTARITIAGKEV